MMKTRPSTITLLLLVAACAFGLPARTVRAGATFTVPGGTTAEVKGYYKNLFTASKAEAGNRFTEDLNRLRLELDATLGEGLRAYVAYDNEIVLGSVLNTAEFKAAKQINEGNYFDLSSTVLDTGSAYWRHLIYRGYARYERGVLTVTAGRQRVALGTGRIWNPEDLLNPVSPLQIERDERTGTDAVDVELSTGPLSGASVVYAPGKDSSHESFFVKQRVNVNGYDLSALVGDFRRDKVLGLDFSGYVGDSGLRGEFTYTLPDAGNGYLRGVVSFDHNFASSLYVLAEYLYNGGNDASLTDPLSVTTSAAIITKNRNFLGLAAGYDVTPLVRAEAMGVFDIDGKSAFLAPSVRYNLLENLDVSAGFQFFTGRDNGEYSSTPDLFYAGLQAYF